MNRRNFLQLSLAVTGLIGLLPYCKRKKTIKGKIVGASASVGHLMRDKHFTEPTIFEQKEVVIIGGGISGLSAARQLSKNGVQDFMVLDLESKMGGNAAYGQNEVSAYPWGAHYIPIPNNDLTEYKDFLFECNVITSYHSTGLPIYNEYYLCFDPQDRLYINGSWQEGLVPVNGVPENDKKQMERFFALMEDFRHCKGKDGKDAFAIPVDKSSSDEMFTMLDNKTMKEWMLENGFISGYLQWYINYCTRDDFGTPFDKISAWAGIHYFASRKGKGENAEYSDVLTWPAGNGWLVQQLEKDVKRNLRPNALVVGVQAEKDNIIVDYLDTASHQLVRLYAKQCIMAVPQFVASRLLKDNIRQEKAHQNLKYVPWMVANLRVNEMEERSGAPLSWDNVIYDSDSLGYVVANHQLVQQKIPKKTFTYYLPLTQDTVVEARKKAQQKSHEEWVNLIVADLKKVHPDIEDKTQEIDIMLWGHGMVQPLPGIVHGNIRKELSASINNKIHFAHTDLAGISIFEEGFYQGLNAAKKVINNLD